MQAIKATYYSVPEKFRIQVVIILGYLVLVTLVTPKVYLIDKAQDMLICLALVIWFAIFGWVFGRGYVRFYKTKQSMHLDGFIEFSELLIYCKYEVVSLAVAVLLSFLIGLPVGLIFIGASGLLGFALGFFLR